MCRIRGEEVGFPTGDNNKRGGEESQNERTCAVLVTNEFVAEIEKRKRKYTPDLTIALLSLRSLAPPLLGRALADDSFFSLLRITHQLCFHNTHTPQRRHGYDLRKRAWPALPEVEAWSQAFDCLFATPFVLRSSSSCSSCTHAISTKPTRTYPPPYTNTQGSSGAPDKNEDDGERCRYVCLCGRVGV